MLFESDYRKYLDGMYWEDIDETTKDCYMDSRQLEKWIQQNKCEYMDCMEGVLLDNMVLSAKHGTVFVFEEYMNAWSSIYHVYYCKGDTGKCYDELWEMWENMDKSEEE